MIKKPPMSRRNWERVYEITCKGYNSVLIMKVISRYGKIQREYEKKKRW